MNFSCLRQVVFVSEDIKTEFVYSSEVPSLGAGYYFCCATFSRERHFAELHLVVSNDTKDLGRYFRRFKRGKRLEEFAQIENLLAPFLGEEEI